MIRIQSSLILEHSNKLPKTLLERIKKTNEDVLYHIYDNASMKWTRRNELISFFLAKNDNWSTLIRKTKMLTNMFVVYSFN